MRMNRVALGAVFAFALGAPLAGLLAATSVAQAPVRYAPREGGRAFAPSWREWVFTSVPTCRAFDTRGGTAIQTNTQRGFYIGGTGNFLPQGGTAGGCGVPPYAKAVQLSLTSLSASGPGNLSVGPVGSAPQGYAVSFQRSIPATSSVTTRLGPTANMLVKSVGAASHVVGDVTGYYTAQIGGVIDFDGNIYSNSGAIVSARKLGPGYFEVTVDRDITYCAILTSNSGTTDVYDHGWGGGRTVLLASWALDTNARSTPWAGYLAFTVLC